MKKTTLLFILFLTGLMACSTPEDKPKQQSNAAPAFQLFPTTNMWTFIKLDTRDRKSACGKYNTTFKATTEWKSC